MTTGLVALSPKESVSLAMESSDISLAAGRSKVVDDKERIFG